MSDTMQFFFINGRVQKNPCFIKAQLGGFWGFLFVFRFYWVSRFFFNLNEQC